MLVGAYLVPFQVVAGAYLGVSPIQVDMLNCVPEGALLRDLQFDPLVQ